MFRPPYLALRLFSAIRTRRKERFIGGHKKQYNYSLLPTVEDRKLLLMKKIRMTVLQSFEAKIMRLASLNNLN